MKFLMVGAGGVGGYFGARLAAAGEDVFFMARGGHLAAMKAGGLRVESPLGDVLVDPVAADACADVSQQADVVLVAVKIGDTPDAIDGFREAVGPDTVVISLQNGFAADDMLISAFGAKRVGGGVVYIASTVGASGLIRHTGQNQRIQIGELAGGESPRMDRIAAVLSNAGIDAESLPDIRRAMWEKFVFLVGLSATTSLTGENIGVIRADPEMRSFLLAAMAETTSVARLNGIDFPEDYAEQRLAFADTLPSSMTSSMYHDLAAGKPLEVAYLSGEVARMGKEFGIATPVNDTVYAALKTRRFGKALQD